MGATTDVWTRRAEALAEGITLLEQGAPSFVFRGTTYQLADLVTLERFYQYALYKGAEEAIVAGAQQHTILGRTFQRAQLSEIRAELRRLEPLVLTLLGTPAGRTGPRLRQGIPLG